MHTPKHHPRTRLRRLYSVTALALTAALATSAQTPPPTLQQHHASDISVNVREVVVDVSVYDAVGYMARGNPIRGLHKEDFELSENGRPQTILSFQEHTRPPAQEHLANGPTPGEAPALSVILVDQASLGFDSQPFLLKQLTEFIQNAPPDNPIALFALSPGLRVVQDFTTDRAELLAALNDKTFGIHALPSPFLETDDQNTLSNYASASLRAAATDFHSTSAAGSADQLDRVQAGQMATEAAERTANTLTAFQEIARYLAALPGRKNLIWLGTNFTVRPFGLDTEDVPQYKWTSDLLQIARVAVYPIDAAGLVQHGADGTVPVAGITDAQSALTVLNNKRIEQSLARNGMHGTLDEIAERTGGEAYYNTNGIAWAMNRVISQSNDYYTLVYSSNAKDTVSGYTKLQVRLKDHHLSWRLSYRRGYFTDEAVALRKNASEPVALEPYMDPGMPALSQVHFRMQTSRAATPPTLGEPLAGQNHKVVGPFTRYRFNLAVSMHDLAFSRDKSGISRAELFLDLVAYNPKGEMINWVSRRFDPTLTPDQVSRFQQVGLQIPETLDLPAGKYLVRVGLYDPHTKHVGTLDTVVLSAP